MSMFFPVNKTPYIKQLKTERNQVIKREKKQLMKIEMKNTWKSKDTRLKFDQQRKMEREGKGKKWSARISLLNNID